MQPERASNLATVAGPGRPRLDVAVPTANAVQRLARSFSEDALRILVGLMYDPDVHGNVLIKAAQAVLDRGLGLPSQSVDVTIQRLIAKKLVEVACFGMPEPYAGSTPLSMP
jgi:hypothetical protein